MHKTATVRAGIKLRLQSHVPQKIISPVNNSKQRPIPINIKINTRYTAYNHLLLVVMGGLNAMLYYGIPIFFILTREITHGSALVIYISIAKK